MLLVGVSDESLMCEISVYIEENRFYATGVDQLIELARDDQDSVVLLDARMGGNMYRAVEVIPLLLRDAPERLVVLLTWSPTHEERQEAIELGAYATVDICDGDYPRRLRAILDAAERRQRALSAHCRGRMVH
jgi:DNA-binding NarL/FixJ family response regulator